MSTRSMICYRDENSQIKGIYCHFDGYIEGVGVVLQQAEKNFWEFVYMFESNHWLVYDFEVGKWENLADRLREII